MIVKWKTHRGYAEIERQECTRATTLSVWFMKPTFSIGGSGPAPDREHKALKVGDMIRYHDTWAAAHSYLTTDALQEVKQTKNDFEVACAYQANVMSIPAEPVSS